jgi:hypothetical protein
MRQVPCGLIPQLVILAFWIPGLLENHLPEIHVGDKKF